MLQKIKLFTAVLLLISFAAQTTLAENFNQDDMDFAFGNDATSSDLADITLLSNQEMIDTEGNVAPLIALGIVHGGRFIISRYVSSRVAASALRRGCSVYCPSASSARSLATRAYGRGNVIRHGPSGHARTPVNYSHYQSSSSNYYGHAFYGRRFK